MNKDEKFGKKIRVLGSGVDNFDLYVGPCSIDFAGMAERGRKMFVDEPARFEGIDFIRVNDFYRSHPVGLQHKYFVFLVNKESAVIRVRSYGLLMRGFDGVRRELCNVLDELAVDKKTGYVPDWNEYARLCRVDVFADVAWRGRFKQEQFKTRLRKLFYARSGESARGETFAYGDRSIFACRVYHKSSEIDVHNKQYMRSIWETVGHIDNDDVYRIEFEHRGKKLDEIYPGRSLGQIGKDTFVKLWSYDLDTIEYMQGKASHRNIYKKKRHPVWVALRKALYTEYPELTKKQFQKAKRDYYYIRARKNTLKFLTFDYHDFCDIPTDIVDKFNFSKEEFRTAKLLTSEGFLLHDWDECVGVEILGNADYADYSKNEILLSGRWLPNEKRKEERAC